MILTKKGGSTGLRRRQNRKYSSVSVGKLSTASERDELNIQWAN